MSEIPRERSVDSTIAFVREGYTFIGRRCRRLSTDVFRTRLMLRPVVCVQGEEAARMFYQPDRFTRRRAMPPTALFLLQDKGSVQLLDGERHRQRKQMFLSLMSPPAIAALVDLFEQEWRARLPRWEGAGEVVLHDAMQEILCRAVCTWAGVPLTDEDLPRRTRELAAMIDGAGSVGPRNWRGLLLRARAERWMRSVIAAARAGKITAPEGCAVEVITSHREEDGSALDDKVAAVELLNVIRPTVAVARFVTFAALAMHQHPQQRRRLRDGDDAHTERFVQEVRRYYPFFPAIGGRVQRSFAWRGHRFEEGTWVLLDLYGTHHDERVWGDPEELRPERFQGRRGSAYDLIPQGGGEHLTGHRCAGEWMTLDIMKRAARMLASEIEYAVPEQDLDIDLSRIPAIPRSRFVISGVRRALLRRPEQPAYPPPA